MAGRGAAGSGGSARASGGKSGPGYFESKKGEVNELRVLLRTVNTSRDSKKKRDVIKKVIAYMTLGIDVSRLFSDMILACNTKDLVIKKMVYMFLTTYARRNPDITLLAVNTLHKDCRDEDPMVRGLALRSLCSLGLPSILEHVVAPLKSALEDHSSYVRRAGVIGMAKVFKLDAKTVRESDMIDRLYDMLKDTDAQVMVDCVLALDEILADEGGMAVNRAIAHHLLGRLKDVSEWGQCTLLSVVRRYTPETEEETFAIMNHLDAMLKVANSAVVLATTGCFLHLTRSLPEVRKAVYGRVRTPLLTLAASRSPGTSHIVLAHIRDMVDRAPETFASEYKQFFCKYAEPSCSKALKLEILPRIADETNAGDIVTELTEYVNGVDLEIARLAIRAIGDIAIRLPVGADAVMSSLAALLDLDSDWIKSQTLCVMRDLLRKYPDKAPEVVPALHRSLKRLEEPEGRAAVIWLLGEYGQLIDDAPYLLEPLIDNIDEEPASEVRLELLTATLKLFFKRPPEVSDMMRRLLAQCLGDGTTSSVHDRALFYLRLLRLSPSEAEAVIAGERPPVPAFVEAVDDRVRDRVFEHEFDSLSVLFRKPEEDFVEDEFIRKKRTEDDDDEGDKGGGEGGGDVFGEASGGGGGSESGVAATGFEVEGDLLGGGGGGGVVESGGGGFGMGGEEEEEEEDLFGGGGGVVMSGGGGGGGGGVDAGGMGGGGFEDDGEDDLLGLSSPPPPSPTTTASFHAGASLTPPEFQAKWTALPDAAVETISLLSIPTVPQVEGPAGASQIKALARGDLPDQLKFFMYASDAANPSSYHLLQVVVAKSVPTTAHVTVKSENRATTPAVVAAFRAALASAGLV